MKYIKSISEGLEKLPRSSFLNWNNIKFEKLRKTKENIYKEWGGKEKTLQRKGNKGEIRRELSKIKDDTGVYFVPRNSFKMQFFSLQFFNVRYKSPILDIFKKYNIDILNAKTHFSLEDRLNRIHFVNGLDAELRGTGLAELLYREFIHYIGWATSNADAMPGVKLLWSNLAKDDEFYTVVTYFDVLAISKKYGYTREELKMILTRFLHAKVEDVYKHKGKTRIDPELLEMFPELEEEYYLKPKFIKKLDKNWQKFIHDLGDD